MTDSGIRNLIDIPRVMAQRKGEAVAVVCDGAETSFAELERRSDQVAGLLRDLGVLAGERVAWLGRAGSAWFEVFFGAVKARACLTPINIRQAAPEVAFVLDDARPAVLFVTAEMAALAQAALDLAADRTRVVIVGGEHPAWIGYDAALDQAEAIALDAPDPDDDVLQIYTSGTTGAPKGVRLSNANYSAFLEMHRQVEGFSYRPGEVILVLMPLFHVAGVNISMAGLAAGCQVRILPDFNPLAVLEIISNEQVADLFLAPVMINALLQTPETLNADFSRLRSISYGASPISEVLLQRATKVFGCGFIQFYGMTESTAVGTTLAASDHRGELLRSCGKPWPGLSVRVVDARGESVDVGEIGEIEIRGPTVMAGYWNRPDATAAAIRAGGWLRTGDAGYINAEGFVFVRDRLKDMIVSGGENIYPAEVENAIVQFPGVVDAAVIGVPDERWGEAVKAFVVLEDGVDPDHSALMAWVRARIAGYKAPKHTFPKWHAV